MSLVDWLHWEWDKLLTVTIAQYTLLVDRCHYIYIQTLCAFAAVTETAEGQHTQAEEHCNKLKQMLLKTKKDLADAKKLVLLFNVANYNMLLVNVWGHGNSCGSVHKSVNSYPVAMFSAEFCMSQLLVWRTPSHKYLLQFSRKFRYYRWVHSEPYVGGC